MAFKIGICGVGAFGTEFIRLFQAHPLVRSVTLCDHNADKLRQSADKFGIASTCPSLDELCQSDVDAIAIFTQNTLHGPHALQALRAGKHVYCSVPSAITLDELTALVRAVEETGLVYTIGETSYYSPAAIYCRQRLARGDFGRVVYGEGEYYHDMSHELYDVLKTRFGADWKTFAGSPPFYYPTHSTRLVVSVTGAHVTRVSAQGYRDEHEDELFGAGRNAWDNPFSNQTMLCQMSNGSVARFNEFRRVAAEGVRMRLYGTDGSYEEGAAHHTWTERQSRVVQDITPQLACEHGGVAAVQPVEQLPREFDGLPNGHHGAHQFLVNEFACAVEQKSVPANNVWQAARYLAPGLVAHQSATQGGTVLDVPDFGDAPK